MCNKYIETRTGILISPHTIPISMSGNAWSRGDGHSELDLTDSMSLDFEKKLGAGTFSQVYRSVHEGALCAIKSIDKTKFFRFQTWSGPGYKSVYIYM